MSFHYTADDGYRYTAVPCGVKGAMKVYYGDTQYGLCVKADDGVACTSDVNNSWYVEKPWLCIVGY